MSTPRRVSMGQRSAQGVTGYHHDGDTASASKPTTAAPTPAAKPRTARSGPPAGTARLSIYWRDAVIDHRDGMVRRHAGAEGRLSENR